MLVRRLADQLVPLRGWLQVRPGRQMSDLRGFHSSESDRFEAY